MTAWAEAFNARDAHALAALYHDDATNLQVPVGEPCVGRDAIFRDALAFFRAFPDNVTRVETLMTDGEWSAVEWSGGGTWLGEFAGLPPNGNAFTLRGCGFFHITDGRIRFQRGYWDRLTWFAQLDIPLGG